MTKENKFRKLYWERYDALDQISQYMRLLHKAHTEYKKHLKMEIESRIEIVVKTTIQLNQLVKDLGFQTIEHGYKELIEYYARNPQAKIYKR